MEKNNIECCEKIEVHEELLKIVQEKMPDEVKLYDLAELFKIFGDSTRIRILFVLFEAEVCVCDLAGFEYETIGNLSSIKNFKTK